VTIAATYDIVPATCPARAVVSLADARGRHEREALRGVCATGRYRCSYYVWGEGPALVFIPGLCDDSQSFLLPIALLSKNFRCIAYDLPTGQGDGARLAGYGLSEHAADLLALLDHVGARQSFVYGSSFGSTIALKAMHQSPQRFDRAILQGGFAHRPLAWAEVLLAQFARWWPWPMRQLPLRLAALRQGHFAPFADKPPEAWDHLLERSGAPPMTAVAHRALLLHELDLRPILPQIRQPVLLICGESDPLVGKACEEVLLRGLPNAVRVELRRCGHMPQFSHPEMLAEVAGRFLSAPENQDLACPRR